MTPPPQLHAAQNLIALERGDDELLLVNSFHLRPLYVQRGRERVKQILAAAASGRPPVELQTAFPHDAALLRLLQDHNFLPPASPPGDDSPLDSCLADPAPLRPKQNITLYLLLGESCNLACIYCLNGPQTYRKDDRVGMSAAVAYRSVAICLEELGPGGTVEVAFFGGEPLLRWPLIKEVIRYCEGVLKPAHPGKRLQYHLTSNLTLSPADLVEWVTRYDLTLVCGIDGPPEIHDRCRCYPGGGPSHARSAATIRRLVQAGARLTLRATITSANSERSEEANWGNNHINLFNSIP